jgi:hypothetical protein
MRVEFESFCSCSSLESIVLPASTRFLCRSCFAEGDTLHAARVGDQRPDLRRIESDAFARCPLLGSVTLPVSLNADGRLDLRGARGFVIIISQDEEAVGREMRRLG